MDAAAAAAAPRLLTISDRRRLPSDGLNPRRIQTGLPGIRRTVYDGALRVNSDAADVLFETVTDVVAAAGSSSSSGDGGGYGANNTIIRAKPEWRTHFPLTALLRPSITTTTTTATKQMMMTITELTNRTVISHQPRIVDPVTGERVMCAVESVETVAVAKLVDVLDAGLMENDLQENEGGGDENGQDGSNNNEDPLCIRGGGNDNDDRDKDVVMEGGEEGGGGGVEWSKDEVVVDMSEADADVAVATTNTTGGGTAAAAAAAGGEEEGGGLDNNNEAVVADASATATATDAASVIAGGGSDGDAVIEAPAPPATETTTIEAVVVPPATATQGGDVKVAAITTQEQQQQPTTATDIAAAAAAAANDEKSQEVSSTNVVGLQQGVADVPSSSTTAAAADSAPAAATATTTTISSTNPPAAPEATTVKSTDIHPLPSNHPPLSTSIPITTTTITPPENAPSWYHPTTISTTEKSSLPEWFNSSAPHRTPATYLSTRNQIVQIYQTQISHAATTAHTGGGGQHYLTPTAIRRVVPGDVGSLLRLHTFLCDWGLMNGKDVGENAPSDLALRGGVVGGGSSKGKRSFEEVKRSTFWSKERLEQLDGVVVKHVKTNETVAGVEGVPQQQQQQPSVDWDAVAKDIGEGTSASDCQRAFLDPPKNDEISVKIAKTSSSSGFDLSIILDGVHPDVLKATINASLKATNDIAEARKASIAGILASTAATNAQSEEEEIARTLMDILDQRMQRLENRVAILDDVEALLEAERVALELERRDMYTTRCRHWFGDGLS